MPHPGSKRAKAAKQQRATKRRQQSAEDHRSRAERQAATDEHRRVTRARKRRRTRATNAAVLAAVALVVGGIGFALWIGLRPGPELAGVERPPDQGRGHISGASFSSSTPTSGPHDRRSPSCRVYSTPLDRSLAVHALEHGAVVLWYDSALPDLSEELASVASGWSSHVIVSPSVGLSEPIVATAWNRLQGYPGVGSEVEEFVETYRRRGPENVSCDQV